MPKTPDLSPIDYLFSLELHGIKLGLANISTLLEESGHPELSCPVVHVAGTNGKGSVLAMLDAALQAAGYRTGRFTSPHLCDVRERFLVDGEMISHEHLHAHIDFFRGLAAKKDIPVTFFEMNTAIAFRHFAEAHIDISLIEVGMGGRFDSTNVVAPAVTGITNISLEHTQYLGDTVSAIAREKAGIVKARVPLVLTVEDAEARDVICKHAQEVGAPVLALDEDFRFSTNLTPNETLFSFESEQWSLGPISLGLPGAFQGVNAAMTVALAQELGHAFPRLDAKAVSQGLEHAVWPGRFEQILDDPPVIVDAAHNPAGAAVLRKALGRPCVLILTAAADKDVAQMIRELAPVAEPMILTQFAGGRALPVEMLRGHVVSNTCLTAPNLAKAIEIGLKYASAERPLVVAGSLYAAGEARTILTENYGAPPLSFRREAPRGLSKGARP